MPPVFAPKSGNFRDPKAPVPRITVVDKLEVRRSVGASSVKAIHGFKPAEVERAPVRQTGRKTSKVKETAERDPRSLFEISTVGNPSQYPYCAVGLVHWIYLTSDVAEYMNVYATAVLVGSNFILTTSSVIPMGVDVVSAVFYPAYNNGSDPYGFANIIGGYVYPSPNSPQNNYGVLQLDSDIGNSTGWMGAQSFPDDGPYANNVFNSIGYPDGNGQVEATDIEIYSVEDYEGSKEMDTPVFASGSWIGGPFWNLGENINQVEVTLEANTPYVVGVLAGTSNDGTTDAVAGGVDMINLIFYAIDNWSN